MSKIVKHQKSHRTVGLCASLVALTLLCSGVQNAKAVILAWNPNVETNLAGYKPYYGGASGTYTNTTTLGLVTTSTILGLFSSTTYYFALTAYNTQGQESDFSGEIAYTTPLGTNLPPVLSPPSISAIANQTINKNLTSSAIPFTVSDPDTLLSLVTVSAAAADTTLLPTVTLGGSGANRTVTFAPALEASGSTTITITASDGLNTTNRTFNVTVTASNNAPFFRTLAGPLTVNKESTGFVTGLAMYDPDANTGTFTLTVRAGFGSIVLLTNATSGVTSSQITGNGSGTVQVTARLGAINNTLARTNGLAFTGNLNFVGSDSVTMTINDNGNTGAGGAMSATTLVPVTVVGNSLDTWRTQVFSYADLSDPTKQATVWGDNADPDGDGRDNLFEYAVGLDPNKSEVNQQAVVPSIADVSGVKYSALSFVRRVNEPLLQYVPEVSSDKLTWSSGTGFVQQVRVVPLSTGFETVYVQDLTPVSAQAPRFIRLRIIKP